MHSLRATALTYALFYEEYELILIYTPENNLIRVKILDKASVFTRKSMNYFKNLFFIVDANSYSIWYAGVLFGVYLIIYSVSMSTIGI